jgi:hypothetical protein
MYHTARYGVARTKESLLFDAVPELAHGVQDFLGAAQAGKMAFAGQLIQLRVGQARDDVLPVGVPCSQKIARPCGSPNSANPS